jgi:hypothetical protein
MWDADGQTVEHAAPTELEDVRCGAGAAIDMALLVELENGTKSIEMVPDRSLKYGIINTRNSLIVQRFEDVALVVWDLESSEQLQIFLAKGFSGMVLDLIADVVGDAA